MNECSVGPRVWSQNFRNFHPQKIQNWTVTSVRYELEIRLPNNSSLCMILHLRSATASSSIQLTSGFVPVPSKHHSSILIKWRLFQRQLHMCCLIYHTPGKKASHTRSRAMTYLSQTTKDRVDQRLQNYVWVINLIGHVLRRRQSKRYHLPKPPQSYLIERLSINFL